MNIVAIDSRLDLFSVTNIYPKNLLHKIQSIEIKSLDLQQEEMQSDWPGRFRVKTESHSVFSEIDLYIKSRLEDIANITDTNLMACDTGFWLDTEGFTTNMHLDNDRVFMAMQVYLTDHFIQMGTEFYNSDNSIRYKSDYSRNSGYLMVNNENQLHSMLTPVPKGHYRLSSYTWFFKKS